MAAGRMHHRYLEGAGDIILYDLWSEYYSAVTVNKHSEVAGQNMDAVLNVVQMICPKVVGNESSGFLEHEKPGND